jgi:hypothetical protein
MYGLGDALPAVYTERFRTQIYNERVVHPGAWNKLVVVAREDDEEAILNHALTQSRRRYRTSAIPQPPARSPSLALDQPFYRGRGDAAASCCPVALAASEVARIGAGISAAPVMTRQKARKRAAISSGPEPIGS